MHRCEQKAALSKGRVNQADYLKLNGLVSEKHVLPVEYVRMYIR